MNADIINVVLAEYGLKETPGNADNPVILQMAVDCGFTGYQHDDTAWCSLLANWAALKAGYERSGKLNARSWLDIGEATDTPEIGDIVVLWRGAQDGWEGHVGFYINKDAGGVWLLAGNQSDMINISQLPVDRVLGYRKLKKAA